MRSDGVRDNFAPTQHLCVCHAIKWCCKANWKKVVRYHAIMHWNTQNLLPYKYRGSIVLSAPHAMFIRGGRAIKIFLKGDTEFLFLHSLAKGRKKSRRQGAGDEHGTWKTFWRHQFSMSGVDGFGKQSGLHELCQLCYHRIKSAAISSC